MESNLNYKLENKHLLITDDDNINLNIINDNSNHNFPSRNELFNTGKNFIKFQRCGRKSK